MAGRKEMNGNNGLFELIRWQTLSSFGKGGWDWSRAILKIAVGSKEILVTTEGEGQVHALDIALRQALSEFYPAMQEIQLKDYSVHIKNSDKGTAAAVKVIVEMEREVNGQKRSLLTSGESTDIIVASWKALVDGFNQLLSG